MWITVLTHAIMLGIGYFLGYKYGQKAAADLKQFEEKGASIAAAVKDLGKKL